MIEDNLVSGAFDKRGKWWYKNQIDEFSLPVIKMCFKVKAKAQIKIIQIKRSELKKKLKAKQRW